MDTGTLLILLIMLFVAFFMLIIGIVQMQSKKPVGFYAGEKGSDETELTDMQAWNIKHGIMWLFYGIIILVTSLIGMSMINSIWCTVPFVGGVALPVPFMIWFHHRLIARYRIKP